MVDFKSNEEAMATFFCNTCMAILHVCRTDEGTVSFHTVSGEHYEVVIRKVSSAADEEDDT